MVQISKSNFLKEKIKLIRSQLNACTYITSEILLLRKYLIVDIQLVVESSQMGSHDDLIQCRTLIGLNNRFVKYFAGGLAEVERFDAAGLLEESICLEIGRDELRSLISLFRGDVMTDGTAFVKNEAVVVLKKKTVISTNPSYRTNLGRNDVRGLTERIFLDMLWTLVLPLGEVNGVELERHLLFVKCYGNTTCVGGVDTTVEFENHG